MTFVDRGRGKPRIVLEPSERDAYAEGFAAGEAAMRERAAQMAQAARLADSPGEVAEAIRALSLEAPR